MTDSLMKLFIKDYNNVNDYNVRRRYGVLSGVIGIFCNIFLFIMKFTVGITTASVSVTADAVNNLSDAGASIVTLVGFKMASKPPDNKHPFGHGRIEYISGLIVSLAIILMGLEFIKSSVESIIKPDELSLNMISIIILIVSAGTKLWMFFFNKSISRKINSSAMKATAMDSLSDVAVTLTVIIGMLITKSTGVNVDGYAGIIVSLFIIGTGVSTARGTIEPLIGESPNLELINLIKEKVLSYDGIFGVHDIFIHNYGPSKIIVSLHVEVSAQNNIIDIHNIIDNIEKNLKSEFSGEFLIHMDPVFVDNEKKESF